MKYLKIIAVIATYITLGIFFTHSLDSINQDIGRHLKLGEIIWQTRSVPDTNLFSFTEPDHRFINHHWLSEVIFFWINSVAGLNGLIVFKIIVLLSAFTFVFLSVRRLVPFWSFLLSFTAVFFILIERTDVRPEIFSYLLLSFFIFSIFRSKYENDSRYLFFLPLLQIIWTNSHIYFALGPILLFFFLADKIINGADKKTWRRLAAIFGFTLAATLVNPHFIHGALAPLNILREYGYSIVENQSIFFLKDYGILEEKINVFEISLVALIASFVPAWMVRGRKLTFEILAGLVFSVLAMRMIRNFSLYGYTMLPVMALNLSYFNLNWFKSKVVKLIGGVIYLLLLSSVSYWFVSASVTSLAGSKKFGLQIPEGARRGVEFVKQYEIAGPVFNNFDVGSFLIWKLYPEQKIFVDGRPEAYSVDFFEKVYKPMQENPADWEKYSELYHINYVFFDHHDITPWAQTFLGRISKDPRWPMVYLDESVVILLKRTGANQTVISRFTR